MKAQLRPLSRPFVYLVVILALVPVPASGQCEAPVGLVPDLNSDKTTGTNVPIAKTRLQWTSRTSPNQYQVYLAAGRTPDSRTDSPINPKPLDGSARSFVVDKLDAKTGYTWLVVAECDKDTASSNKADFITTACSGPSNRIPGAGSENVIATPTFEWTAADGASKYEILASIDGGSEIKIGETFHPSLSFKQEKAFPAGARVSWRVRAITSNGCGDLSSSPSSFTVISCEFDSPEQGAPTNGSTQPTTVKFSWKTVGGASDYGVVTSVNGGTDSETRVGNVFSTELKFPSDAKVVWFVRAYPTNGCAPVRSKSDFSFVVEAACPTGAPRLLEPGQGASVPSPVTFKWDSVPGVEGYELFVADKGSPTFSSFAKTKDTAATVSVTGAVQWYVEAVFPGSCPRGRSDTGRFEVASTVCPKEGPALVSPPDGASIESPVVFEWASVAGAQKYSLQARKAGDSGPFVEIAASTVPKVDVKLPAGDFEWRVVAFPDKCDAVASSTRRVSVRESSSCGSNRPPELLFPPNGEIFKTDVIKFVWTFVTGASSYELQISEDGGASWKPYGVTKDDAIAVTVPAGKLAWRVLAQFPGCKPLASLPRAIEVTIAKCSSSPPTLLSPPSGSSVSSPVVLQWSAVSGADYYRVFASIDGNSPTDISGALSGTSFEAKLPAGSVTWFVEAFSRTCGSASSAPGKFQVDRSASCPTAGPRLVSPANGASGVPQLVKFTWEAVQGASSYQVFSSIDGSPPASIGTTTGLSLERNMKGTNITWAVAAITAGCDFAMSAVFAFTLGADDSCAIPAPSRLLPLDNSSGSSPMEFQWTSSGPGTYYRLVAARDGEKESVLAETMETGVKRHLEPGSYTWYVDAFRKGCRGTVNSTRGRFAVVERQTCPREAPAPLAPADGVTLTNPEVVFLWSPVTGAIAYELWLSRGDGVETLLRVTTETSATIVLPSGKMRWFVRALFDGCEATRSQALSFAVDVPDACRGRAPMLLAPPIDEPVELSNPIYFGWTPATGGSGPPAYEVIASIDDGPPIRVGSTSETSLTVDLPAGRITWLVRALRPGCSPLDSSRGMFVVRGPSPCAEPRPPAVRAVLEARSGVPYRVAWLPGPNSGSFIVEESTDPGFTSVIPQIVAEPFAMFVHEVGAATPFYYRVFAISDCDDRKSLPSEIVKVVVTPATKSGDSKVDDVRPIDTSGIVEIPVRIGGSAGKSGFATNFTASTTQPWMSVSPSSGTIPPEGITLTITANTENMEPGANTGSLVVTTGESLTGRSTSSGSSSTPVSVSLVSPVTPTSKSGPKPDSLIFPAVGHATGFNSQWRSDVRVSNISAQPMNYLLFFTPSGQAGTGTIKQASITVGAGSTVALDDVVKTWFGIGADGSSATGTLEVRPQSNAVTASAGSSLANGTSLVSGTVASSRTYNQSAGGTFGQFIPPVAFSAFAGKGEPISLQQVSQSSQFRTNIGVAEGAGEPATVRFTVFSNDGQVLGQWEESLKAGEQRQFDQIIAQKGLTLEGGRVEVEVVSDTGKVTAYASTVDNQTGDPIFIRPVNRRSVPAESKLVVPGVADLDSGIASWRTDVRLFNAGDSTAAVTLSYYPQGSTSPAATKQVTVGPGAVLEANDILKSTFGISNSGGALHITTDGNANIVPTARTYNKTETGTYGQFIPAVSASHGARIGGAPLQLLQVEQSSSFRTNLGLAELSGSSATVEVTASVPGKLIAPIKRYTLGPNEFRQINAVLSDMGIPEAFNARVSIRVVEGNGSINAYASVVDNVTQDPTYVPAQ